MSIKTERRCVRGVFAILLIALLAACGDDSGPGDPTPGNGSVSFRPNTDVLRLIVGDEATLWVEVYGVSSYTVTWRRGGATVATTDTFRLQADRVGVDTIQAVVVTDVREQNRSWRVDVAPDLSKLPREVSGLNLFDGDEPTEVEVFWLRSSQTENPLESYVIAVSYDGIVDNENWDQAEIVAEVPHAGLPLNPSVTLDATEHGLLAGQRAWFAIRARDDLGQLSLVKESKYHDVTYPWYLEVHVKDDQGQPLPTVILKYADDRSAVTDANGDCTLGPFRNVDTVPVATLAASGGSGEPRPWYFNYAAPERGVEDGPLVITLVEKIDLDLASCGTSGDPYFDLMSYMMYMTFTNSQTPTRPNRLLYRWPEYPLRVHVEDLEMEEHALGDFIRSAMAVWNGQLGFEVMTEVADIGSADVRCVFDPSLGPFLAGLVRSLTAGSDLSREIPQVFEVAIDPTDLHPGGEFRPIIVTEVALHEFGHALGLYNHSCSSGKGNLMDNGGGAGILDDGPENAIREAELRAVRAITKMPQAVDMSGFDINWGSSR